MLLPPDEEPVRKFDMNSRVLCRQDGALLLAGDRALTDLGAALEHLPAGG